MFPMTSDSTAARPRRPLFARIAGWRHRRAGSFAVRPFRVRALAVAGVVALGSANGAASAADLIPVRFEQTVNTIFFLPQHVAMAKGFYKQEGLDVKLRTSQGSDKAMSAILTGGADIALLGPETVVYVYNSESPAKPRIFAGLTATDGFMILGRKPEPGFTIAHLKGKEVMGYRPGSTPDIFLAGALRKNGLAPKSDVKITANIAIAARAGAWISGKGDYGLFLEPEATQIEKAGNGVIVASLGRQVGLIDYTVYAANDGYIRKNPQVIQAWTNAVKRAQEYTERTDARTLAQDVIQYFPGLTVSDIEPAIQRYKQYGIWKKSPRIEPAAIEALQSLLIADGVLEDKKRVPFDAIVTNIFADQAK
ncbi:MAG: ABC transporter substrate-binding protein [Polaromonas sp.]|nr:ABC transporter substrate-binding protein [Polaromonas sp.]